MVEINLAAATPSLTAPSVAPSVSPSFTPVTVAVASLPDALQALTRLTQISGSLAQTPVPSSIVLTTASGIVTLALPQLAEAEQQKILQQLLTLLQTQKPLTVVLQPGAPPTQAVLLIPQAPAAASPAVALGPAAASALPQIPAQPLTPIPLAVGMTLDAVVLPPGAPPVYSVAAAPSASVTPPLLSAGASPPVATTASAAPSGSGEVAAQAASGPVAAKPATLPEPQRGLASVISSGPPPEAAPSPLARPLTSPTPSLPAAAPSSLLPPSLLPKAETPPALTASLQPGKEIVLRVDSLVRPSAPPLAAPGPDQIAATVIGRTATGQVLLQAGDAALYVRTNIQAAAGTRLLLTVAAGESAAPLPLQPMETPGFSSLPPILAALAQIDPALARQFIANGLPQPALQFSSGLLLFFSILRQGDASGWLGDAATSALLKAGRTELLARLTQDIAQQTGQTARDGVVGEWRAIPVPVYADGQVQTLRFYVHNDKGRQASREAARREAAASTRFLIDMRMTRLGALQIDGLVKPRKLDMIVRSERGLPPGLPQELRDVYARTLGALGYTGGLGFQTGRQNWLIMQKQGTSREA